VPLHVPTLLSSVVVTVMSVAWAVPAADRRAATAAMAAPAVRVAGMVLV
jgi:hypothetical protein